jgi:hypothetical protein
MDLEAELVRWMDEHEAEMLDLLREEEGRFLALHPGIDPAESRAHVTAMANRRFIARALGAVLPRYLQTLRG